MRSSFGFVSDTVLFGALIAEFLILAHAQRIGIALGVMDHPDHIRKRHPQVTPLVGGLAIMTPILIWTAVMLTLGSGSSERIELAILLCGAGAALLGYTDDQSSTSPSSRLLSLLLLTAIALVIAPELMPSRFVSGLIPAFSLTPWTAYGLITIAMAGFVNSVNMADGQNGIVTGMFVIWSLCLIVATGGFVQDLSIVVLVASILAFVFNMAGKVFLGDGGTYGVTFVLGLLAVHAHNAWGVSAATICVWFLIPVIDCVRLIISRVINGRAPSDGDRNHFHHKLQVRVGRIKGLVIYLGAVAATSIVAAYVPQLSVLCLLVLLAFYASLASMGAEQSSNTRDVSPMRHGERVRILANPNLAMIEVPEQNIDAR